MGSASRRASIHFSSPTHQPHQTPSQFKSIFVYCLACFCYSLLRQARTAWRDIRLGYRLPLSRWVSWPPSGYSPGVTPLLRNVSCLAATNLTGSNKCTTNEPKQTGSPSLATCQGGGHPGRRGRSRGPQPALAHLFNRMGLGQVLQAQGRLLSL